MRIKFCWILVCSISCTAQDVDGSFESFILEFSRNPEFQLTRVSFPLDYTYHQIVPDTLLNKRLIEHEWAHIEFPPDSVTMRNGTGAYQSGMVKNGAMEVIIHRSGIDNGMNIEFYFTKIRSKWYLVKIVNIST
jgi:hypothetical protein